MEENALLTSGVGGQNGQTGWRLQRGNSGPNRTTDPTTCPTAATLRRTRSCQGPPKSIDSVLHKHRVKSGFQKKKKVYPEKIPALPSPCPPLPPDNLFLFAVSLAQAIKTGAHKQCSQILFYPRALTNTKPSQPLDRCNFIRISMHTCTHGSQRACGW